MTIEAMKQALEALETVDSLAHYGHGIDEARETLRQAIKQALEALETVDSLAHYGHGIDEARETLRQAIKQAEKQEPIAWLWNDIDGEGCIDTERPDPTSDNVYCMQSLFNTPVKQAWVGLTNEDIKNIQRENAGRLNYIRATENKLKELNK